MELKKLNIETSYFKLNREIYRRTQYEGLDASWDIKWELYIPYKNKYIQLTNEKQLKELEYLYGQIYRQLPSESYRDKVSLHY